MKFGTREQEKCKWGFKIYENKIDLEEVIYYKMKRRNQFA